MVDRNYYPGANRKAQWKPSLAGGATFTRIDKLCLHTTETSGWPGYPQFAPQLTYDPWTHVWHQHMPLNRSATTLMDPSNTPVRENRDNVIQIEIVGYCDTSIAKKYGHSIYDMDDAAYRDLAEFAVWLHREWGLPIKSTVDWVKYPASAGLHAHQRLSSSEYDAYKGILGHQHVSGNEHGDPGKIDIAKLLKIANDILNPTPVPPVLKGYDMTAAVAVNFGTKIPQPVAAGAATQVKIDDKGHVSAVAGENSGIDVYGNIEFNTADLDAKVDLYWARGDVADSGTPAPVYKNRRHVSAIVPASTAAFGLGQSFKGTLAAPSGAGQEWRLRLFVKSTAAITITAVSVTGWKMP